MKVASLARMVIPNLVILALLWGVLQDSAGRLDYFRTMGFTTSTSYYPFFYITSAVNGSTNIPGTLTLDWTQVLVAVLVILDAGFVWRQLRRKPPATSEQAVPSAA